MVSAPAWALGPPVLHDPLCGFGGAEQKSVDGLNETTASCCTNIMTSLAPGWPLDDGQASEIRALRVRFRGHPMLPFEEVAGTPVRPTHS